MTPARMRFLLLASLYCGFIANGAEIVSLCQVLKNPAHYEHKELVIHAGFRVGFEWQELVCVTCPNKEKTWVEFDRTAKGLSKLPKAKAFDQLEKVTFQGTFEGGPRRYGHLNGYSFQFRVTEVKAARRVWKLTPREHDAPADIKATVCED